MDGSEKETLSCTGNEILTFIVTSYNYAHYLRSNLESICSQWSKDNPFNVVIVDDGSSDNSWEIAESYCKRYNFVELYSHPCHQNHGLIKTLLLAIQKARTDWLVFLESDDLSTPDTVSTLCSVLKEEPTGLIFFDIEALLEEEEARGWFESYIPRVRNLMLELGGDKSGVKLENEILRENLIPTFSCAVVRKDLLEKCSFNCPVPSWIDWFLWIQVAQESHVRFIDKKLVRWRIHKGSQNNRKKLWAYLQQYSLFRRSVLLRLKKMDIENKTSKIAFLTLPSVIPLGIRFLKMARYVGIKRVIKEIYRRLKK